MTLSDIGRLLEPLRTRVVNMLARAVVQLVDDSTKMQILQLGVLATETRAGVERFQNYGFTSVPLAGAEAAVIFLGGRRDHGIVVAVDDRRYRLNTLQPGEVAIYTDQGDSIIIQRGGTIQINASTKINVVAPVVEMSGDLIVDGDVLASGISLKTHVHNPGAYHVGGSPVTGQSGSPA